MGHLPLSTKKQLDAFGHGIMAPGCRIRLAHFAVNLLSFALFMKSENGVILLRLLRSCGGMPWVTSGVKRPPLSGESGMKHGSSGCLVRGLSVLLWHAARIVSSSLRWVSNLASSSVVSFCKASSTSARIEHSFDKQSPEPFS